MTSRQPWERQEKETDPAWAAFVTYRDQETGERSIRDVARTLAKSVTLIGTWSKRWSWVDRVHAWDMEADRLHRQSLVRQRRLARNRHLRIANAALDIVEAQLKQIADRATADPMKDADVIRLLTDASRLQRDVLGEVVALDVTSGGKPLPPAVHVGPGPESLEEATEELRQLRAEIERRLSETAPENGTTPGDQPGTTVEGTP